MDERLLGVARTIADFEGAEAVGDTHLSEAADYRSLQQRIRQQLNDSARA